MMPGLKGVKGPSPKERFTRSCTQNENFFIFPPQILQTIFTTKMQVE